MQIFVTDPNPITSARRLWNNTNRAIKMITETQQILACCQLHFHGEVTILKKDGTPFKTPKSRINHPCVKWACEDTRNAFWLICHLDGLLTFYEGEKFTNAKNNVNLLIGQKWLTMQQLVDSRPDNYLNFAKADAKGLDYTHIKSPFVAYDKFLAAQGA